MSGTLAALLALACAVIGIRLQTQKAPQQLFEFTFTSGGYAPAHLDDVISVASSCAGKIAIRSGMTTVSQSLAPVTAFSWLSLGDDQYQFLIKPDCPMRVTVAHREPAISPLWTAALFAIASAFALLACWWIFRAIKGGYTESGRDVLDLRTLAPVFLASFAAFVALPSYYHNDAVGGNLTRNWGYRGWGYFDTARDVAWHLAHQGIAGLPLVQTFGKPLGMPFVSLILGFGASPYTAGPVLSAILTAFGCAAIAMLSYWKGGSRAAVAAAAIFALNPVVLAYSTSFYEECGWIAGIAWAAVFAHLGMQRRSNRFFYASILCAAFAVSAKQLLVIPLTLVVIAAVLLYLGHRLRDVTVYTCLSTLAVLLLAILFWPFLWQDTAFRLPFILGARVTFETVHGMTVPLSERAIHALAAELARNTPLQLALLSGAVLLWLMRKRLESLWVAAALAAAIAFTTPTSFFLQHYVLYSMPFIAIVCADAAASLLRRVDWKAVGAIIVILQGGWSALFFPYPALASVTCATTACSTEVAGIPEPVYGLREAAGWLDAHGTQREKVLTLAAPHVLQAYLPQMQVLFSPDLPPSSAQQQALADKLRVRYVVLTDWYKRMNVPFTAPGFHAVYAAAPRFGDVTVYARNDAAYKPHSLPDVPEDEILDLHPSDANPVVFVSAGTNVHTSHWIQNLVQTGPYMSRVALTTSNMRDATVVVPAGSVLDRELRAIAKPRQALRGGAYHVYVVR